MELKGLILAHHVAHPFRRTVMTIAKLMGDGSTLDSDRVQTKTFAQRAL